MMRRLVPVMITLGILTAFAWTLLFLYEKSQARPVNATRPNGPASRTS